MLAYVLALVVGLGSLAIYLAAFFFPEIHRKNDFIWSGVGLFYALVIWVFAPRITGGLLLGHVASVALLVWFGWQTLSLRRQLTPQIEQTPVPSPEAVKASVQQQVSKFSVQEKLGQLQQSVSGIFSGVKDRVQQTVSKKPPAPTAPPKVEIIDKTTPVPEQPSEVISPTPSPEAEAVTVPVAEQPIEAKTETLPEVIPPNPPSPELVEAAQPDTEEKQPIPVEEIAPDAILAPPAEAPPEQIPPQ
ncbi:Ycf66 protein [Cylindrospermum stagnale PCC 7417]|uniref:Ycf66 protein n=1 Tax=Cylindrospermum stagnale PCC 7417 TaxID=56107 RepID=K9WS87_9NOST|nr:Ycf66 family protein [Cylindrospermum stagnale]AFZ23250.1 Ycf66 protein [Cylindrospermum stagnale PCC 7417]